MAALQKRMVADFDIVELLVVLRKTKRKSPGNDGIFINQIKDLYH